MKIRAGLNCVTPDIPITAAALTSIQPQPLPVAGILGRPVFDGPEISVPTIPIAREPIRVTRLDPKQMVPAPAPPAPIQVEPAPMLELRVRAVIAYDNGTTPPVTLAEARERVAALVENANKDFQGSGLRLVFFPRADVELRQDTKLRRDVDLSDEAIAKLESGTVDEADGALIIAAGAAKVQEHRQAVGDEQPGKMMWLFSPGNRFAKKFDDKGKFVKWEHVHNRGGSYSGLVHNYVALNQAFLNTLANAAADASRAVHETGHYLGLPHTHIEPWHDIESMLNANELKLQAAQRFALWKERIGAELAKNLRAGATLKAARELYDSDRGANIFDTPADPSAGMIALANEVAGKGNTAYGPINEVTITVPGIKGSLTLSPMRDNAMSYFLDDKTSAVMRLTPDQARQARFNLTGDSRRRRLVAAQLGDTATPDLRVCAVWSPNAQTQRLTWNRALDEHNSEHNAMAAKGMVLAQVQAYTRKGSVRYDGIWNPGTQKQEVSLGLTDAAVNAEQSARIAKGLRPVRVQGYQHLTDGIRYNVIYDAGSGNSQILIGVTQDVLFDEYAKAKKKEMRMVALSSHVNGHGQARYSSIFRTSKNVTQAWVVDRTLDEIVKEYDKQWKAGLKIREISVVKLSSGHRWSALFEPDAANQLVYWAHVRERIGEVYDEMWAIDFKLRGMCVVSA
jgi:hypothetical protein